MYLTAFCVTGIVSLILQQASAAIAVATANKTGKQEQKKKIMFLIKHFVLSNIHLGHKTNKWNPRTASFLLGMRDGIHVIDLEQTILMAKRALNFVKKVCERRGYIFFVCGTSPAEIQSSGRNLSLIDNPRRKNPVSVSLSHSVSPVSSVSLD